MAAPDNYLLTDEFVRLESFSNWPVPHIVSPASLANAGFFYLNQNDQTQCAFCKGIIGKWEVGDNPDTEHIRHFPLCPYVQRVIRPRLEFPERDRYVNTRRNAEVDLVEDLQELGINVHQGPLRSEYATVESRLSTFSKWPQHLVQTPEELAEAGFYYNGHRDNVHCFSCGGGITDWLPEDNPWTEHAKWYPKCNYVLLVKGEGFVKEVRHTASAQEGNKESNSGSKVNGAANVSNPKPEDTSLEHENRILKDARLCKICMDNESNVIFLPCRHLVTCEKCASSVKRCPICRRSIKATVKTYFS